LNPTSGGRAPPGTPNLAASAAVRHVHFCLTCPNRGVALQALRQVTAERCESEHKTVHGRLEYRMTMPRSRKFDENSLLDAAIELFWVHGYAATSLAQVSTATGVTNGSLYQAYGSKRALFLAAYRKYCAQRVAIVADVFTRERPGIEQAVTAYFDAIVANCAAHADRRGCLMLNTISELGTDPDIADISSATVDAMEDAVAEGLCRVVPRSADAADITVSAAQIVALSQALIQLSRMGRDHAALRRIGAQSAAATERLLQAA